MRFLLTSHEYPLFMRWHYERNPGLENRPYEEQLQARLGTGFLWADFYSRNLRALGHEAVEVVPDNDHLQWAWAREHGLRPERRRSWRLRRRRWAPWIDRVEDPAWKLQVLAEQIRAYRPDVLLVRDILTLSADLLREARPHVRLIVGQHASGFDSWTNCGTYDLMLSSLPNLVRRFASQGLRAEPLRLGFESTVLDRVPRSRPERTPLSFVGKLKDDHVSRSAFLAELCRQVDVEVWGPPTHGVAPSILTHYRGPAWGIDMFQVLRDSKIGLNHHETWAGPHANNLRMYEATGVGTLLLTDWKDDLPAYFEPGSEVVAYRSVEECRELVRYYLDHDAEREAIAAAGQRRTLREHTYRHRMLDLLEILRRYL